MYGQRYSEISEEEKLREITRALTGRRDRDIPYLRGQIRQHSGEPGTAEALRRILRCLAGPGMQTAAA